MAQVLMMRKRERSRW